jgi:carboxylesterase type B
MKISVLLCVLQVINFATRVVVPNKFKIINTKYGPVRGIQKRTDFGRFYFSYQGIPYMKPPVGKLKFTAPEPKTKWTKPLDATKEPPAYNQIDLFSQQIVGQEDTGVINVYTPAVKMSAGLPVLVWIHGGKFNVSSTTFAVS